MASSDVDIASQALICLGVPAIQSMTDAEDNAVICNERYEDHIKGLISAHPWRFAMRKKRLGRLTASPTNEWTYKFTLPTDRVGDVFAVFNSGEVGARPIQRFEIFGNNLHTDHESIYVDYKVRPSETEWPPYFVTLAIWSFAAEIAEPVTDDTSKAKHWDEKAYGTPGDQGQGGQIRKCRNLNAFQQPPQQIQSFPLVEARYED